MAPCNKSSVDYIGFGCCALALVLYVNTLNAGFVYDDRRAVLENPDILSTTPWKSMLRNDFWGTPISNSGSHGSYRPVCVLSYKLNYIFGGFRPFGYHLVNILLHCLATGLVVKLSRRLLNHGWGPAITGSLFASHPIHTEAVAGIVGRADLAACNFYLLAFLFYMKHINWREKGDVRHWIGLAGTILLSCIAVLCKETAVTALLVCTIYDSIRGFNGAKDKSRLRSVGILGVSVVVILCLRLMIPRPKKMFSSADNPTANCSSIWTRFLTFSYLPAFNFKLLLNPNILSFDWGMDAIPRITTIFDQRNVLTVIFYGSLVYTIWINVYMIKNKLPNFINRRKSRATKKEISSSTSLSECVCEVCKYGLNIRHSSSCRANNNNNVPAPSVPCGCPLIVVPTANDYVNNNSDSVTIQPSSVILLSISLLALPFLPAANLFFYVGFVVAERILYLPSIGYCLLIGVGLGKFLDQKCESDNHPNNNGAVKSQQIRRIVLLCICILLCSYCVKTVYRNLDWKSEESLYRSAIRVNPPKALGNLGSVLSAQKRYKEAKYILLEALKYRPNMADVHYNLGVIQQIHREYKAAVESFQKAIHFRPSLALAYLNLGTSLIALGRCQEAASVLREGSKLDGTGLRDHVAHENAKIALLLQLGSLYADQGKLQRALAVYREALHSLPEKYPPQSIYHRMGDILSRLHQWVEAEKYHKAALEAQPDHIATHLSYGAMLARNMSRTKEAEQWYKRALRLAPTDPNVYYHYAEFLSSLQRHKEACEQRLRAAEFSPNNYSLVVSAATALRLMDRKFEAEKWYRKAVQLRPDDARAHTNLGAILHLLGRSSEAVASYKEALKWQPGDPTTLANLAKLGIVKKHEP